ncbi:MAG: M14 family zinc carboxypeptidase [Nonlabens sp.]|uniref:M14 family zinc carboxypeptidase n=1 Tax=Nonlabens sp. TaxID=1888209 RepID=UPI0035A6A36D
MLSRYYTYSQFENYFGSVVKSLNGSILRNLEIGQSVLKRSVYGLKIGSGKIKVLAWSQMHGNESTTTRAICELLASDDLYQIIENIELYIIPVLNPDGADAWTRVNANKVDLNRDAVSLSQPESILLQKVFKDFKPDYCFNLHGQRSIYGSKDGIMPAQVSFLAPAGDKRKLFKRARAQSMSIINDIHKKLEKEVSGIIGRYNDDFNINCVGDFMMSKDVPTILFEAGHSGFDYSRDEATLLLTKALKIAITSVSNISSDHESTWTNYKAIPKMSANYVDILIKNYKATSGNQSLSIRYHEQVKDSCLYFVPVLIGINRKEVLNGHRVIDLDQDQHFKNDLIVTGDLEIYSESLNIKIFAN